MISRRSLLASFALGPFAVDPFVRAQQQTSSPPASTQPPAAQPPNTQPPSAPQATPQQSDKVFTSDVKVVNVFATVRDKKGQIEKDLKQDDFTIDEDGRPQTIRYFAKEANLPLTLGLLVDTSGSMRRLIETERSASFKFLDQVLREDKDVKDVAFLIHFDYEIELLQDLTSSRKLLQDALSQLSASNGQSQQRGQQNPYPSSGGGGGGRPRGGTTLYDAILLGSNELMKKQTGRKAIILLTDGDDNGSKSTMTEAISAAQRADTQCYAIRFADESSNQNRFGGFSAPGMGRRSGGRQPQQQSHGDGKKVLERIAQETGGGYFEGGKKESLDDLYRQIQEELRNQYSLGYTPDKNAGPGYRAVRVLTKNKNLVVQARDGYYADK